MNEHFKRVIEEAKKLRYPYNHIRVLAYIATRILGDPGEIKIIGGLAAAYYTNGYTVTVEADIYAPKLMSNPDILTRLGFKQHKEYIRSPWILEETKTVLDFIGLDIPFRFIEVEIGGDRVQIMALEDTLAYYLSEIIRWEPSKEAVQRVNMIFMAQKNELEPQYLKEALQRMNAYETLRKNPPRKLSNMLSNELIKLLEDIIHKSGRDKNGNKAIKSRHM
ncbi:MAG: hypothetical protein NXY59_09990 [Aigarchaeota archaeon]|nr:hypothetical protein [Candidatus Pelearchaeum maunauluense]